MSRTRHFVHVLYDNVHAGLWAVLCVSVFYIAVFVIPALPAAHARFEHQRVLEISAENRFYCERWGMPAGTLRYKMCVLDLGELRAKIERRLMDDSLF